MSDYTVYTLEKPEAKAFLRKCLEAGRILSAEILKTVTLDDGYISTAFPKDSNLEKLYSFEEGGIIPPAPKSEWKKTAHGRWEPVATFRKYIVDVIHSFVNQGDGYCCIIEDALAKPTDSFKNYKSKTLFFRDTVFHHVSKVNGTVDDIEMAINWSKSIRPPTIGVLTVIDTTEIFMDSSFIPQDTIKLIAQHVEKIFIEAYDMEGYLVWHKKVDNIT